MALRLLETISGAERNRVAKVYRDAEWQEYRVRFYEAGALCTDADYHCDDKSDAQMTARAWAWSARLINLTPGDKVRACLDGART